MKFEQVEDRLAELQAEIEKLQKHAYEEAVRKARYPWENPEIVQNQQRVGYNFKMDPQLYLKIQWIMENKGGIKSIQTFLDRAAKEYAETILDELATKSPVEGSEKTLWPVAHEVLSHEHQAPPVVAHEDQGGMGIKSIQKLHATYPMTVSKELGAK